MTENDFVSNLPDAMLAYCTNNGAADLYRVPIFISGHELTGLADTGASQTIINDRLRPWLEQQGMVVHPTRKQARLADGRLVPISGVAQIGMHLGREINQVFWKGECLLMPNASKDVIVGRKQLGEMDAHIFVGQGKMRVPTKEGHLVTIEFEPTEDPTRASQTDAPVPVNLLDVVTLPVTKEIYLSQKRHLEVSLRSWQDHFELLADSAADTPTWMDAYTAETPAEAPNPEDWDFS